MYRWSRQHPRFERLTVDEHWSDYDHRPILERYLQTYRDLQADYGLL